MRQQFVVQHPNLTVLLPGSCSASCSFCFWNRQEGKIKPQNDFVNYVVSTFRRPEFSALSISGGEPTESRFLVPLIMALAKDPATRRKRIVLTTYAPLKGLLLKDSGEADTFWRIILTFPQFYVNVSRHEITDAASREAFASKNAPELEDLSGLIAAFKKLHVPVNLNCVHKEDVDPNFVYRYIYMAETIGASSVTFRKEASDILPTLTELKFAGAYPEIANDQCPVCRSRTLDVNGFPVRFKGSVAEPSVELDGYYEAVIHPDGKLYADWGMQHPIPESIFATREVSMSHEEPAADPQAAEHPSLQEFLRAKSKRQAPEYDFRAGSSCSAYRRRGC